MIFHYTGMHPATAATRRMLLIAALFNVAAATLVVVLAHRAPALLNLEPMTTDQLMYVELLGGAIACFGLAYGLAGIDLPRFWPYIAIGVVGKLVVVLIVMAHFLAGSAGTLVASLVCVDALFVVLFVQALRRHAR